MKNYLLRTHAEGGYLFGSGPILPSSTRYGTSCIAWATGSSSPVNDGKSCHRFGKLSVALDVEESPDYVARRIWYGFGPWGYNAKPYLDWCARNRATSGIDLKTGHAYGGIIRAMQAEFDQHPEFYATVDGKSATLTAKPSSALVIPTCGNSWPIMPWKQFDHAPAADSISMDPSDGGGWCECDRCAEFGEC